MAREKLKRRKPRGESTEAKHWGGAARSSVETAVMARERRGGVIQQARWINRGDREESAMTCKAYDIRVVRWMMGAG